MAEALWGLVSDSHRRVIFEFAMDRLPVSPNPNAAITDEQALTRKWREIIHRNPCSCSLRFFSRLPEVVHIFLHKRAAAYHYEPRMLYTADVKSMITGPVNIDYH